MKSATFAAAFVAVGLFAAPVHADEIEESTALKVVGTSLMLADCGTTYYMMRKPGVYSEMNPLLGRHPSPQKILFVCAGTITAAHVIDHFLDPHASNIGWAIVSALELHAVINNAHTIRRGRKTERWLEEHGRSPFVHQNFTAGLSLYRDADEKFRVSVPIGSFGVMFNYSYRF